MKRLTLHYDRKRDVLYVLRGHGATRNLPFTPNEDIRLDPETYEVVGYVITNFSLLYPKLVTRLNAKERWFVTDFFDSRLKDWNTLLAPLRTLKARTDFLMRERADASSSFVHR